jgi:AraC family transcriptional regulator of arabinose operon
MSRVDDACPPASPIHGGRFENVPHSSWRARGLRDYVIMYILHGRCRIGWKNGEVVAHPGDVVLLSPGVPHDYGPQQGGRWGVLWSVFSPRREWIPWLTWPGPRSGIGVLQVSSHEDRQRINHHLEQARIFSSSGVTNGDLLAMNALEAALLWCWNSTGHIRGEPRIQKVIEFISRDLRKRCELATLARVAGISVPHFARLFRQHLGTTPQRFLEDRRLDRSCELLRATPMSIEEISQECGFTNAFYFSTRFKKRYGIPPRAWRKREYNS